MPLIPNNIDSEDSKTPKGERQIFKKFKSTYIAHSEDSFLFHSLNLQESSYKLKGEADFVYLDDEFLIFFEVKGGMNHYDPETNTWHVMGGAKEQDPFKQVTDALFSVRDTLLPRALPRNGFYNNLKFGYGVMFPDVDLIIDDDYQINKNQFNETIEYAADLMYLANDHLTKYGLDDYLERVKSYWRNHTKYKGYTTRLAPNDVRLIKDYFRKDLVFEVPILSFIEHDNSIINLYSEKQKELLKRFTTRKNIPYIVEGGAGTGKTILALELAKEQSLQGLKTLYICFNKNLKFHAEYLLKQNSVIEEHQLISFENLHSLLHSVVEKLHLPRTTKTDQEYFDQELPKLIQEYKDMITDEFTFDYLIIDEGQDLMNEVFMDSLEVFLKGGWESNNWALFVDAENQDVFKNFDPEYYNVFDNMYPSYHKYLDKNYRNTRQIVEWMEDHSGLNAPFCDREGALDPKLTEYKSMSDLIVKLSSVIARYHKGGVTNKQITVLSSRSLINRLTNLNELFTEYNGISETTNKIFISTPYKYKGIENDIILFIFDTETNFNSDQIRTEIYISYTRAKSALEILIPESIKPAWGKFILDNMKSK